MSERAASAVEIATRETLAWLREHLPAPPARVLEVGCGAGELAAALAAEGHSVVALDASAEAVERAQGRGVPARLARFPDFEPATGEAPFGALLFARVLHHVDDLPGCCARAAELLAPGGVVLVEDFGWEDVDRATAAWLYGLLGVVDALGHLPEGEWDLARDPLEAWRLRNAVEHALHPGATLASALSRSLQLEARERAPYAYRWVARLLEGQAHGAALTASVLAWERGLIAERVLVPLGLRLVARRVAGTGSPGQAQAPSAAPT